MHEFIQLLAEPKYKSVSIIYALAVLSLCLSVVAAFIAKHSRFPAIAWLVVSTSLIIVAIPN